MSTALTAAQPVETQIGALLQNLIKGSGTAPGTTQTIDPNLLAIVQQLAGGLQGNNFSREQAVTDIQGTVSNLARSTAETYVPQLASQQRGSGLRSSTTNTLLRNDADARLQGQLSEVIANQIARYGQLQQGQVTAASGALNASRQQQAPSSGDQIKAALTQGAVGIGATAATDYVKKLLRGGGAAAAGSPSSLEGFFTPSSPISFGGASGGAEALTSLGSGSFDSLGLGDLTGFLGSGNAGGLSSLLSGSDVPDGNALGGFGSAIGESLGAFGSDVTGFLGSASDAIGLTDTLFSGAELIGDASSAGSFLGEVGGFIDALGPFSDVLGPIAAVNNFVNFFEDPGLDTAIPALISFFSFGLFKEGGLVPEVGAKGEPVPYNVGGVNTDQFLGLVQQALAKGGRVKPEKGGGMKGYADGGKIDGPSPGYDNKVATVGDKGKVALEGGEFIIKSAVVDKLGEEFFTTLNEAFGA